MPPETFEKMFQASERLIEKGTYDTIAFRLSGGEPFLAFDNYKDMVSVWNKKMKGRFRFGMLTNLTLFTDEMAEWMKENNIGMQVSLDDLYDSKPLNTGKSSSDIVLKNIIKAQSYNISFSINTVLDIKKTASLVPIANYVSGFKNKQWGLSASFTMSDDKNMEKTIAILKEGIGILKENRFDIYNNLRFYNMIPIFTGSGRCGAGTDTVAIGTGLEVWPCQSQCAEKPIGYYDENIDRLLRESKENEYFYKKMTLPECAGCPIFNNCRGGCRVTHGNPEINKVTCHIRREIMTYIFKTVPMPAGHQNCEHDREAMEGVYSLINNYIECLDKKDKIFVETPSLEELWKQQP